MSLDYEKIGNVIDFIRGVTFKPEQQVEPLSDGSIVVMRTKNVQISGLDISDLIAIPKSLVNRCEQNLRVGDILMSTANSWELVGKSSYVPKLNFEASAGGFISIIRALPHKIDSRYLYHWITNPKNQQIIRYCGRKTTNISNLDVNRFKELEIPLPPLEEQKRIAAILDKADAIRQKRQKAIELADEFLRSVFLDMFGPVVNKDNWPLVTFADVTTIDAPMVDPLDDLYLDMLHVGPDRIEKNTGKLLPALTARDERLISKKFLFDEEYVLYSKIRPYLRKVALPNFTGLCSADMYPVKPAKNMMTREYLWQLLLSDAFTQYTETLPDRANIPKLNRVELASYAFRLPPIQLQNKFTDIYKKYSKSLLQLDKVKIKSESIFSSLSQQAFSGQL